MQIFLVRFPPLTNDCNCRKEELCLALDQLLRDEDDTTVSTPYTAAVLEYRVVIHDPLDAAVDEKWHNVNGHAIVDAQHPVRYIKVKYSVATWAMPYNSLTCILTPEGQMWLCKRSFTLLHRIVLALIWNLTFLALELRKYLHVKI